MKWCMMCKRNVEAILKQHPTLAEPAWTCPHCDSTYLKNAK
jgi:DNA-directed RNA polymerase subunit RPC12/RpoP